MEPDRDKVDVGDSLYWETKSIGQLREEGRGHVEIAIAFVHDAGLCLQRGHGADILGRPHNRGNPHIERWALRRRGLLDGAGEHSAVDLGGGVGIKVEVTSNVEVLCVRRQLVDRDLEGVARIGKTAGQHQGRVHCAQQVGVSRPDHGDVAGGAARTIRGQIQVGSPGVGGNLWKRHNPLRNRGKGTRNRRERQVSPEESKGSRKGIHRRPVGYRSRTATSQRRSVGHPQTRLTRYRHRSRAGAPEPRLFAISP